MHIGLAMDRRGGPSEMFLRGIATYARPNKPWVFTWDSPTPAGVQQLLEFRPDGILGKHLDEQSVEQIMHAKIPLVCLSPVPNHRDVASVENDNLAIGNLAAEYFVGRGYKHFGYYARNDNWHDERLAGFQAALQKLGHDCHVAEAQPSHPSWSRKVSLAQERKVLKSWLLGLPHPVAVFCVSDNAALSVAEQCRELGLSIPDQVALLGVDNDVPVCALAAPPLSSVQIAGERMGYLAAKLLDRMLTEHAGAQHVRVPPVRVVTRRSTEVIVAPDPLVARALAYLQANLGDEDCLHDFFATIGCSRRTLERKFRESIGISPAQAWLRFRLEEAERLLSETELSIEDVASRCGFSQVRQLQVAFKKILKQTPSHFRKHAVPSFRVSL